MSEGAITKMKISEYAFERLLRIVECFAVVFEEGVIEITAENVVKLIEQGCDLNYFVKILGGSKEFVNAVVEADVLELKQRQQAFNTYLRVLPEDRKGHTAFTDELHKQRDLAVAEAFIMCVGAVRVEDWLCRLLGLEAPGEVE